MNWWPFRKKPRAEPTSESGEQPTNVVHLPTAPTEDASIHGRSDDVAATLEDFLDQNGWPPRCDLGHDDRMALDRENSRLKQVFLRRGWGEWVDADGDLDGEHASIVSSLARRARIGHKASVTDHRMDDVDGFLLSVEVRRERDTYLSACPTLLIYRATSDLLDRFGYRVAAFDILSELAFFAVVPSLAVSRFPSLEPLCRPAEVSDCRLISAEEFNQMKGKADLSFAIGCLPRTTWARTRRGWWDELVQAVEAQPDLGAEFLSLCKRHPDPEIVAWAASVEHPS